ncbi:lysylphosphatidylglycerol synthase transmembrane domain-containing protein [Maribacter sp. 2307ULW6-5]|uniref:lysylphosphatidylglycerol synthase transmembrane domain-containing protein n=1 Tax=Maribacter sp. 2307ULW6-5 TaxID=3386275 RepID=UPI0039BCB541
MASKRKTATAFLKLLLSAVLIYFVFTKIELSEIRQALEKSDPPYLILALLLFVLSKIIAAFRLHRYLRVLQIPMSHKNNLKLYLQGMFYNLFLPGGIGGDAYKGYRIKKAYGTPVKKVFGVLVLDRLSGLLLLFLYACALLSVLRPAALGVWEWAPLAAIPLAVGTYGLMHRKFFGYAQPVFWTSLAYSAAVQLAQLFCVMALMLALGITGQWLAYLLVFLVSSIVSVVPLTLGGIGSRELTFFYGASLLGLDETLSIAISIGFFLITALVSLTGVYHHFKKIDLEAS